MQAKVYLREWFFNSGIVGFLRILEHNHDNFAQKRENYIEFDLNKLSNFHKYYFKYFFDTYNVANTVNQRIDQSFEKIKKYMENTDQKENQEKAKNEKKHLKELIKKQMDKIKKFDEESYSILLDNYNQIDKIKDIEQIQNLQEIVNSIKGQLEVDKINKRLTMNLFKNILSQKYFGQPSFLNVVKTALTFEEQEELMYKDYISNIIETNFLREVLEEKYDIQTLKQILDEKIQEEQINKEVKQVYNNIIKKYIQKEKDLESIKKYIEENVFQTCSMCEEEHNLTSNYSESNFVPLAISSDNMKNFFWNQNAKFPVCDLCKLILFCIPAGITSITKTVKENEQGKVVYKEKELLSFVNYDTDMETLYTTNNSFKKKSYRDKEHENNPYTQLILDIVSQNKKISQWQLENIFVVEFEAEYLAYSRMEYFNIKRYVAKFFQSYSDLTLNKMNDYRFKLQVVDYMLKNKELQKVINERLLEELKKENRIGYNCYLATKVRAYLRNLKKEDLKDMDETIKKANNKLKVMYILGNEIYEQLEKDNNENKLDSYIYKMLNCIKGNRKNEFVDTAIRVIWSVGKDVPEILVKNNEEVEWQELGHSFIAGLTRSKYVKDEEEKKNG